MASSVYVETSVISYYAYLPGDRAWDGFSFDVEFPAYQQRRDESANQDYYRGGRV
jgi:hypothetical protein